MFEHYGAVLVSLTYTQTTQRLTVLLFKAQNLNLVSDDNQGVFWDYDSGDRCNKEGC